MLQKSMMEAIFTLSNNRYNQSLDSTIKEAMQIADMSSYTAQALTEKFQLQNKHQKMYENTRINSLRNYKKLHSSHT